MADQARRGFINDYTRDYYGGGLMSLIGLFAFVQGTHYDVGSLTQMGPGFFPAALGVILVVLGVGIAGSARRSQALVELDIPEEEAHHAPEWRGWICILSGIVAFVVLGRWGGLLPATFAVVFISAMGDRGNSWKSALILSLAMSALAVLIFWWALKLQFPLFSWG
ncbi:MAG TPA: tripartite tricarboxylate transporter TctB family protein [Stellaceae bacterium]|nr:tripartite tricarboxylate transporter TctB family protein [Stellaceae bacterium]